MVARIRAIRDIQRRQGRRYPVTPDYYGRLLHLCGTQGDRLHADPKGPQPGRPQGFAAAVCRCIQADVQGNYCPDQFQSVPLYHSSRDYLRPCHGGMGCHSLHRYAGVCEHQCGTVVYPRDDFAGRLRGYHRWLGIQLEIRASWRDAVSCTNRRL